MNSPFSGCRVFVVEDEMIVAWLLEDMPAELGCVVIGPAAKVDQALAMIEAKAIDVAVLDINLNGEMSYPIADALAARGVAGKTADAKGAYHRAGNGGRAIRSKIPTTARIAGL